MLLGRLTPMTWLSKVSSQWASSALSTMSFLMLTSIQSLPVYWVTLPPIVMDHSSFVLSCYIRWLFMGASGYLLRI